MARCEHDAVGQLPSGELQYLTVKALNEWDSKAANGVEWRQKLDTQRGAVLANELRNNACKLAKWAVQVSACIHILNLFHVLLNDFLITNRLSWLVPIISNLVTFRGQWFAILRDMSFSEPNNTSRAK